MHHRKKSRLLVIHVLAPFYELFAVANVKSVAYWVAKIIFT